ncbi:MAG: ISAs1 family transposase, partial [Parabacteroides distasonis]
RQDSIKRKAERAARNLDTIQKMVLALIAVWKNRRKKISDKQKGTAQIIRELSVSFTNVLHFLSQK